MVAEREKCVSHPTLLQAAPPAIATGGLIAAFNQYFRIRLARLLLNGSAWLLGGIDREAANV